MATKEKIQALASENSVLVFSKSYCPYCKKAKQILTSYGVEFKVIELDQDAEGAELQSAATELINQSTVPMIWINNQFVGGCSDLEKLHSDDSLKTMLAA